VPDPSILKTERPPYLPRSIKMVIGPEAHGQRPCRLLLRGAGSLFDPIQTLAAKIAVLHDADIIQCRCASFRRHNLGILPKLPSVPALSDDIALREGGR
jgi:hypothetical protein